jgi:hypothetical protein
MVVITRIDSELKATKAKTIEEYKKHKDKITNIEPILQRTSGYSFYNMGQLQI